MTDNPYLSDEVIAEPVKALADVIDREMVIDFIKKCDAIFEQDSNRHPNTRKGSDGFTIRQRRNT